MAKNSFKDKDKGEQRILRLFKAMQKSFVVTGIQKKEGTYESGVGVADVAFWHEFGFDHVSGVKVPSRSFIRASWDANIKKYERVVFKLRFKLIQGKISLRKALRILGLMVANDQRNWIQLGKVTPDIKESTKAVKLRPTPLDDSGKLLGAISFKETVKV